MSRSAYRSLPMLEMLEDRLTPSTVLVDAPVVLPQVPDPYPIHFQPIFTPGTPGVIARVPFAGDTAPNAEPLRLVLRSHDELLAAFGSQAAIDRLGLGNIDWATQMVLVVSAGSRPTSGYAVQVTGLEVNGDTLTVTSKVTPPANGQGVFQAFTHPAEVLLVERFDGNVQFAEPVIPTVSVALSTEQVRENAGRRSVVATLTRTGDDLSQPLTVTLTNSRPGRVAAPRQVVIPAGQASRSIYLGPINNQRPNGDTIVDLTISAPGHESMQTSLTIQDDDLRAQARDDTVGLDVNRSVLIGVLDNDNGVGRAGLRVSGLEQPEHGRVELLPYGVVHYIPAADFTGVDSFRYTVRDRFGRESTATVTVHVNPSTLHLDELFTRINWDFDHFRLTF